MRASFLALAVLPSFVSYTAHAQYTPSARQNAPAAADVQERAADASAPARLKHVSAPVTRDTHGNARGNQYDLAIDGAFEGQTVLILDQVGNTLANTRAALKEKGLASVVYRQAPTPKELAAGLS